MKKPLNIKIVVIPTPFDPNRIRDMFTVMAAVGRLPKKYQRAVVAR